MSNLNMHGVRDYATAKAWLNGRETATLCYATTVQKVDSMVESVRESVIEVVHHNTGIIRYHEDGTVEIQCQGWVSPTTATRLHGMTPPEVRVSSAKGGSVTSPCYNGDWPFHWTTVVDATN